MTPNIEAQASQAATQGQQMLQNDQNQANSYRGQFGNYQTQADAANKNVQDYTNYMKGAGSAGNQYHTELGSQLNQLGYNPDQMTAARSNLNQATGALSAYSDFANQAASKWGLNAGGFAAANAGALSGLNNNIASNQNVVNGLSDLYKTAQTGANQFTGQVVQGEQNTLQGLQSVYNNAADQRDQAAKMITFYEGLAKDQGGMNAQQQQYYAQARQAYAQASQAMAQTALLQQQYQQQQKLFADQQAASARPNTGIGVLAPGHTGITDRNGNVIGVYNPNASATPAASAPAPGGYNPISEFFTNPKQLGHDMGNGIGNAASSVWNAAGNRLASNARIFGL